MPTVQARKRKETRTGWPLALAEERSPDRNRFMGEALLFSRQYQLQFRARPWGHRRCSSCRRASESRFASPVQKQQYLHDTVLRPVSASRVDLSGRAELSSVLQSHDRADAVRIAWRAS